MGRVCSHRSGSGWFASRWLLAVAAGVVLAGLLGGVLSVSAGARSSRAPRVQKVSELYALDARAGTLRPLAGKPGRFELTLRSLAPDVVWSSDRPARHRGEFPDAGLASEWKGFGFGSRAPEAALVFHHGQPDGNTEILKLTAPRYDKRHDALSFAARWVDPRTVTTGKLAADAKTVDPTPPRSFNGATLLINETTAPVINGCIIQPWTICIVADLRAADLTNANLTNANLHAADLEAANLTRANLTGANLHRARFDFAMLTDANLTRADLGETRLRHVRLFNANLTRADLIDADLYSSDLSRANLYRANLTDANLTRANLNGVVFCLTVMPDRSLNNSSVAICAVLLLDESRQHR